MTDNTQPLALMLADRLHHEQPTVLRIDAEHAGEELRRQHARIAELEAQLASIGAGGVSGPLMGQPQEMPDLSALTERGAKAWAGVDAQGLRLRNYVERRKRAKQLDVNKVHAFDAGCGSEAELLLSDIETLLSLVEAQRPAQAADSVLEDAARLDWLEQNIFHRELDEWDSKVGGRGSQNMWVLFAPKGVQGSARKIIDAARKQGGA